MTSNTSGSEKGNFVAEWFGHRVSPVVSKAPVALDDQRAKRCPFLSTATLTHRLCIKRPSSLGVCTISSASNGPRQDWLVCPYRSLDADFLERAVRQMFHIDAKEEVQIHPAPTLENEGVLDSVRHALDGGGAVFLYLQDKLGGEVSLSSTARSPEVAFDVTVVQVEGASDRPRVSRFGVLEVQTMDFHGSYEEVVKNLQHALRLHEDKFPTELQQNQQWLSKKIEGPNIANVFKRTFYQMMVKFQLGGHGGCVGAVFGLPVSVWDSWQRHLGAPNLKEAGAGVFTLRKPLARRESYGATGWVFVFDIDAQANTSPRPIVLRKVIETDAASLSHYALDVAPKAALEEGGSAERLLASITRRLAQWWPEFREPSRSRRPVAVTPGRKKRP